MLVKTGRRFLAAFFRRDAFVAISRASLCMPMITHRGFLGCYAATERVSIDSLMAVNITGQSTHGWKAVCVALSELVLETGESGGPPEGLLNLAWSGSIG